MSQLQKFLSTFDNYNFNIESSIYSKQSKALCLEILYSDNVLLNEDIQQKIKDYITTIFPEVRTLTVKYKKNYVDSNILIALILQKVKENFPIIELENKIELKEDNQVLLFTNEKFHTTIQEYKVIEYLEDYLINNLKNKYTIEIIYNYSKPEDIIENDTFIVPEIPVDEIKLESVEAYIGMIIDEKPRLTITIDKPCEGVAVCGIIKNFKQFKTKEKVVDGKLKAEKIYYKFQVIDYTSSINVVYFPTKTVLPKMEKLADDLEIFIYGDVEDDLFSSGFVLKPKNINLCLLPKNFFDRKYKQPVPINYKNVFPQKYEIKEQIKLFSEEKFEVKNEFTKENTFVVFDLETTGVEYNKDCIIEIGAIKIVNGVMTETFSCLVNPEIHIPESATKVNGIVDADVKFQHTIGEVIGDFYKFCDGAIMVSYVIDFDFKFIDFNARKFGYNFENKTLDAFVLAKQKIKHLKNYKLTNVCLACGVLLENAHRAVYDAIATAEVFLKLLEK